jgi:hypothetical protein
VKSEVDLAKLYLLPFMAKFTGKSWVVWINARFENVNIN